MALMNVIQEAYINGVSTRKIEKKSLGIEAISRGQVSQITKELNDQVAAFRERPLQEVYPVLWIDSLYEKIRVGNQVNNMAVAVVIGVDEGGQRDILAVEPMYEESEAAYQEVFNKLKARGLKNPWLVISDAHKGLINAIKKSFVGCSWQRCKVHFMRNILAHVPAKGKAVFSEKLKQIWLQPDKKSAEFYANSLMDDYKNQYPDAINVLEGGLEDSLQFYAFERIDHHKISSTNILEQLNREIRRRTSVVGVFPSMDSYVRLVTTYLIEYSEEWSTGRCYIRSEIIQLTKEDREKNVA